MQRYQARVYMIILDQSVMKYDIFSNRDSRDVDQIGVNQHQTKTNALKA